ANPPVAVSLGPLALTYLLTVGGAGYFRAGTVRPFLDDGSLIRVAGAPEFSHSAYVVHAAGQHSEVFARAREGLHLVAKREDLPGPTQPVSARSELPADTRR
ncbi:MAG: LysR family transcriptional regulator, partial [Panacagrimonas sp.]